MAASTCLYNPFGVADIPVESPANNRIQDTFLEHLPFSFLRLLPPQPAVYKQLLKTRDNDRDSVHPCGPPCSILKRTHKNLHQAYQRSSASRHWCQKYPRSPVYHPQSDSCLHNSSLHAVSFALCISKIKKTGRGQPCLLSTLKYYPRCVHVVYAAPFLSKSYWFSRSFYLPFPIPQLLFIFEACKFPFPLFINQVPL